MFGLSLAWKQVIGANLQEIFDDKQLRWNPAKMHEKTAFAYQETKAVLDAFDIF